MKQLSTDLKNHIAGEVTTLATCWKITRCDNTVQGFTSHDQNITYDSVTYKASTGFTPSAIDNSTELNVDQLNVEGILSSGDISEDDIRAGRYDFAEIEIFQLNYADTAQGVMQLRRGWLGEVKFHSDYFMAEVRGLTQLLSQRIGELYSPSCRATLGDARCGVNLASYTKIGSVTTATSITEFIDSARNEVDGLFDFGTIIFTSGANNGVSVEVKEYSLDASGGHIILALPLPFELTIGDTYEMIAGCDKTITTCHDRYNNVTNFRGEPSVPGMDRMLETAGTRSEN